MSTLGIIPARYASTRLPGKPLVYIKGKTMIQRVYENAVKAKSLNDLIIATDDKRIKDHVHDFGGEVIMTSAKHKSGSDRCCEVIKIMKGSYNNIINIQGDEPFINPKQIDLVTKCFDDKTVQIATLVKEIKDNNEIFDSNIPKVIINSNDEAVYFSRSPIPYYQKIKPEKWSKKHKYFKHIGIYGFRADVLKEITNLQQSPLEIAESLEQLRWIENGYKIKVAYTKHESYSVDTPEDLKRLLKLR
ncbi:3-deoxy-manno-octulosonate cytidylyltransferase [Bacteroidales bacterium AH-315-N07]|nr:3-deoxy-manno-octulosonate cytidylyltransferase [Bacteroidales bacterium AH-315-N07]